MASGASIQAARAEFLDPSLYDDSAPGALSHLSRGTLLTALSRAFDLAEGRKPGHAQRVAFVGAFLAGELGLGPERIEDVFFGCLLHDVGMAATGAPPRPEALRSARIAAANAPADDLLASVPGGRWSEVVHALQAHCEAGARIARKLGFNENVARAVAAHHDCYESSALAGGPGEAITVARIVAAADRVETMIDAEGSPLAIRRRGPALVREMAGRELDPYIAGTMAAIAARDDFWFGFYDNDLAATLMTLNYGGIVRGQELFDFLGVLSDVIDGRNHRLIGRGRRVAELARQLAITCDMPERRADLVAIAALLQDIGTLGVPAHILGKPDILSVEEMAAVQQHPTFARDTLSEIPGMGAAAWWVGCHHERVDGKGYPGMLEGEEVPLEAQIIGICEAYDALTSDRPYRSAMTHEGAMAVIQGLSGARFQPHLVEKFEAVVAR